MENSIQEQFADLLEDQAGLPQTGAATEPAVEAEDVGSTDDGQTTPPADKESQSVASRKQEEQEIEIGGKRYKLSELNELVRNAETWRNQLPHYQRLYEQEKQRAEQLESIYRQQQAEPQQQYTSNKDEGPITEDKIIEMYEPHIQKMIKNGVISEDLYAENPALVAHFVHFQETQFKPIVEFIEKYAMPAVQFIATMAQQQQQQTISSVSERLASIITEMAKEPDAAELADENVAAQFVAELASRYKDPQALTDPDLVRQEWVRRNWTKYRQIMLEAAKNEAHNGRKAMAAPGGSGVRPAGSSAPQREETWFEDLLQEKVMPTR